MEDLDADDMFVVIVGDGESKANATPLSKPLKIDNLINTAMKVGEFVQVNIKTEPQDDYEIEFLEEVDTLAVRIIDNVFQNKYS